MNDLLVAIVGDTNPQRQFTPAMDDPDKARKAAEELGAELARRGARLLVYGGPYLESDVVRGFVGANPEKDKSVLMYYTKNHEPPPFAEEQSHPKLFQRRTVGGDDWEIAFYRSITQADAVILIGGNNATMISGQVAIGARMGILALPEFGGAAARVWDTLSAGEDLPTREELDLMASPWSNDSASECVDALFAQKQRRELIEGAPKPLMSIVAGVLFLLAIGIAAWMWGNNSIEVWMFFLAPLLAGGAGAAARTIVDYQSGVPSVGKTLFATIVLGLIAGGIASVLFVTAQLTADPELISDSPKIVAYSQRTIPYALAVGFIAGMTSQTVLGRLLGMDVVRTVGVETKAARTP
jgi:hypothetical protein